MSIYISIYLLLLLGSRGRREAKVTKMVALMIVAFLFAWTPYAGAAIAAQYFDVREFTILFTIIMNNHYEFIDGLSVLQKSDRIIVYDWRLLLIYYSIKCGGPKMKAHILLDIRNTVRENNIAE